MGYHAKLARFVFLTVVPIVPACQGQDLIGEPCHPDQLRVTTDIGVGGGNIHISVRMTNTSNRACVLAGAPRVTAVSSSGDAIPLQARWPVAEGNAEGGNLEKGQELIALAPGTQGLFVIHTLNKTGFSESRSCTGSLCIYLPDSSSADRAPGNPDSPVISTVTAESCGEISISGYRFT